MPVYKTPDVYVEEISTLPPSIAEVSTAIPAFIGYTASDSQKLIPTRITTFLEFTTIFGGAAPVSFSATINDTIPTVGIVSGDTMQYHKLYYALDLYFKNGGSDCYIVSLGAYGPKSKDDFIKGIDALETEDEPTLIILSEATTLSSTDYYELCQHALLQCATLQDRFCILDISASPTLTSPPTDSVQDFRNNIGINNLSYGAAYYPYLNTSLNYVYDEHNVTITPTSPTSTAGNSLYDIKQLQPTLYNAIKQELTKLRLLLPPSPAIAGIYAMTDRTRGVWKAPANVSLNSVVGPTVKITSNAQEDLNVDTTGGKSINAIRSFTGKGTLVWGARTLDGSSNEWRYVPVRRLFIMIEESAKKASYFAVFEPNDATTWLKVKGMIESFLYGLWQQGALAGSTSKAAYYVNVGLGTTMTQQDILEGRLIVEIGIAAVRPAEFIILRFSHKLQEA
jgi:phage tail sheath protein FI